MTANSCQRAPSRERHTKPDCLTFVALRRSTASTRAISEQVHNPMIHSARKSRLMPTNALIQTGAAGVSRLSRQSSQQPFSTAATFFGEARIGSCATSRHRSLKASLFFWCAAGSVVAKYEVPIKIQIAVTTPAWESRNRLRCAPEDIRQKLDVSIRLNGGAVTS